MGWSLAFDLVACLGHLAVAILVLLRAKHGPLAIMVGLLALDMFGWNFANFAFRTMERPQWHWLDLTLSPFSPALAFHVILTFVGKVRRLRPLLVAGYLAFGVLSGVALLAFVLPDARLWIESPVWSGAFLVCEISATAFGLLLLVLHLRAITEHDERVRARIMILATIVGVAGATTDMWDDLGIATPALANLGSLAAMTLIGLIAVRFRFFGARISSRVAGASVGLALLGLSAYLVVLRLLEHRAAILVAATAMVTFALVFAGRRLLAQQAVQRQRLEALATLGKFSAQMSHDLKNPLAALKGGVQFLNEEVVRGHSLAQHHALIGLVAQQVQRIEHVIEEYQRLGRVQPQRTLVDVNRSVRDVLALQPFASGQIQIKQELDDGLPRCELDQDLLGGALDNLIRNAEEAMPDGGTLTVRTRVLGALARPRRLLLAVEDTGVGMDARAAERAFDDFFTTKATGSGLGLAFVRRVAQAHGGDVSLTSVVGRGTTVNLSFPLHAPEGY